MIQKERMILLEIKAKLFDNFRLYKDHFLLEKNFRIILECLNEFLHITEARIVVNKDILSAEEQILVSYPRNLLSTYLEEWENEKFLSIHVDEDVLIDHVFPNAVYNKMLLLKNSSNLIKGAILCVMDKEAIRFSQEFWKELAQIFYKYIKNTLRAAINENDKKNFKNIYKITSQFHASMDIGSILKAMLNALRDIYPSYHYTILLSNDTVQDESLPIELIDYQQNQSAVMDVFLTGKILIVDRKKHKGTLLYFPLKGKQGIYGVVKIVTNQRKSISEQDTEFIDILVQSAANAIEKAQLYLQSEQLVADLRTVTEFTEKLNARTSLKEIIEYATEMIRDSFHADKVAYVLYERDHLKVLPGSSPSFFKHDYELLLMHIRDKIEEQGESVFAGNFSGRTTEGKIPFRSLMAEPLKKDGKRVGFGIVLGKKTYAFSFNAYKIFQSLTHHISLALTNVLLREELEKMVITDYLTKLYTRKYLDDQMTISMERDDQGAFLLIDIDDFKKVNDRYGHQVGDEVLTQVSRLIQEQIKGPAIAARWGGEELAVYLPNQTLDEGIELAKSINEMAEKQTTPKVTLSIGVSSWSKAGYDTPFTLFKRADDAMYIAKERGKNQVYG